MVLVCFQMMYKLVFIYLQQNNLSEIAWRKGKIGFEPPQQQWMQNKAVQQLIMDAKQVLLKEKIISHISKIKMNLDLSFFYSYTLIYSIDFRSFLLNYIY